MPGSSLNRAVRLQSSRCIFCSAEEQVRNVLGSMRRKGKPAMSEAILVAYATRGGSTREVADAIAATLRKKELRVEVRPVEAVDSILPYSAVVLGAPIYYGHWEKEMLRFLGQHTVALISRPVAIFALGPLQNDAEEMKAARIIIDKALVQFPWLTPVAGEVFV